MKAASLFSGIGAPEQAMPHWQWLWHAEIENFPNAVMGARHPQSINLGDVNAEDFVERALAIGRPDVLVFGSPCQSFSVAGRRLGMDDPRGNLALVALGIVARIKPRWFVFENVPGLMSSAEGRDFGLFLRAVDELGYSGAWSVLDAQYTGVAQRRERVFFVGSAGDWRGPAAVLLESEGVCGNLAPRRQAGERTSPTIEARANAGGAGWGTDFLAGGGLAVGIGGDAEVGHALTGKQQKRWDPHQETHVIETPDVAWALQERDHKGVDSDTKEGHLIIAEPITASYAKHYGRAAGKEVGIRNAVAFAQNQRDEVRTMDVAGSLANEPGMKQQTYVAFTAKDHGADAGEVVPPLTKETDKGDQDPLVMTESVVRRLLPVECEKLQGFSPGYTAVTYRGKSAADGPRYKALGNSMAVPCIRWVLSRIEAVDAILTVASATDGPARQGSR